MLYALARPLLFALDPETAHALTLELADAPLRLGLLRVARVPGAPVRAMGLDFPNPVGLAAGLDKNAAHIDALATLGFGFLEVGTVTPRPQPGNPRPRLFRLPAAQALINRIGFNNVGLDGFLDNLARASWRGVLGINIGKNFDTPLDKAGRRLRGVPRARLRARELRDDQHLLAQHAGPARSAGQGRAGRPARAARRAARAARRPARAARAAGAEGGARPRAGAGRRRSPTRCAATASTP